MRKIKGQIQRINGLPWSGAIIQFQLNPGTYTSSVTYPAQSVYVETDAEGKFEQNFFTNTQGEVPSQYACTLPDGYRFTFNLPPGDTDVSLSLLQQTNSVPGEPQYQTLLQYIDTLPSSGTPSAIKSELLLASVNLSALRVVAQINSGLIYADCNNADTAFSIVGVTSESCLAGQSTRITSSGYLSDNSMNWLPNLPIFVGNGGQMTQIPPSTGYLKRIATPVGNKQIYVNFGDTYQL